MQYHSLLRRVMPCLCVLGLFAVFHAVDATPKAKVGWQGIQLAAQSTLDSDPQVTNDPDPSADPEIPDDPDPSQDS